MKPGQIVAALLALGYPRLLWEHEHILFGLRVGAGPFRLASHRNVRGLALAGLVELADDGTRWREQARARDEDFPWGRHPLEPLVPRGMDTILTQRSASDLRFFAR